MGIPFTQYLRPDGRKTSVAIDRPAEIEAIAQEIRAMGYRFECEELTNGMASFTVASPHEDEGDIVVELCQNGPAVPEAVDKLVRRALKAIRER